MSSQLSQFHYQLSKNAHQPDFDSDNFQPEDIYHHYTLKVCYRSFLLCVIFIYCFSINVLQLPFSWIDGYLNHLISTPLALKTTNNYTFLPRDFLI